MTTPHTGPDILGRIAGEDAQVVGEALLLAIQAGQALGQGMQVALISYVQLAVARAGGWDVEAYRAALAELAAGVDAAFAQIGVQREVVRRALERVQPPPKDQGVVP